MSGMSAAKDLVVLVADKDAEFAVKGLLSRQKSLRIRPLQTDVFVHPGRDSGCFNDSVSFLRGHCGSYSHALVFLDRDGSGQEALDREAIEARLESGLTTSGWEDRAAAIVLSPELEIWVWSDSPEVDVALGWTGRTPSLREWLRIEGHLPDPDAAQGVNSVKPADPKAAFLGALRASRTPRSASLFEKLAQTVGLDRCSDPAFLKLKATLRRWFT